MNTNSDALIKVIDTLKENFIKSQEEKLNETNEILDKLELMEQIYNSMNENQAKTVFKEAQSDLFSSMVFCFQGYYRQAYICLRSSIELILSFLYYYDNHYDFILWKNDCIDMTWSQLTNPEKGVFNSKYLSLKYGERINIEKCLQKFKDLYHLTSQYVHGKYEYMQRLLNDKIEYSEELISDFFKTSISIIEIEILILYIRFKDDINSKVDSAEILKIKTLLNKYEVIQNE